MKIEEKLRLHKVDLLEKKKVQKETLDCQASS